MSDQPLRPGSVDEGGVHTGRERRSGPTRRAAVRRRGPAARRFQRRSASRSRRRTGRHARHRWAGGRRTCVSPAGSARGSGNFPTRSWSRNATSVSSPVSRSFAASGRTAPASGTACGTGGRRARPRPVQPRHPRRGPAPARRPRHPRCRRTAHGRSPRRSRPGCRARPGAQ